MYAPREFYISNGKAIPLDVQLHNDPCDDAELYFEVTQNESIVLTIDAAQNLILAMMDLEAAHRRIREQTERDET